MKKSKKIIRYDYPHDDGELYPSNTGSLMLYATHKKIVKEVKTRAAKLEQTIRDCLAWIHIVSRTREKLAGDDLSRMRQHMLTALEEKNNE